MRILFSLFLLLTLFAHAGDLEDGVRLFKTKNYAEAEVCFERATHDKNRAAVGQLGKALCHVAMGDYAAGEQEFKQLSSTFTCSCDHNTPPQTEREQASAYDCRQAIRLVANKMRKLVEKLVRDTVPGIFKKIQVLRQLYPYIDLLERNGLDCCERQHHWECCSEPLVQQFEVWNSEGLNEE
jgi:hypothetical protein